MSDYQSVTFAIEYYKDRLEEIETKLYENMYSDIMSFIRILLNNDYVCVIREEEYGIVTVEFAHDESIEAWGYANPHWITQENFDKINSANMDDYVMQNQLSFFD